MMEQMNPRRNHVADIFRKFIVHEPSLIGLNDSIVIISFFFGGVKYIWTLVNYATEPGKYHSHAWALHSLRVCGKNGSLGGKVTRRVLSIPYESLSCSSTLLEAFFYHINCHVV